MIAHMCVIVAEDSSMNQNHCPNEFDHGQWNDYSLPYLKKREIYHSSVDRIILVILNINRSIHFCLIYWNMYTEGKITTRGEATNVDIYKAGAMKISVRQHRIADPMAMNMPKVPPPWTIPLPTVWISSLPRRPNLKFQRTIHTTFKR